MGGQLERAGQIISKRPTREVGTRQTYHEEGGKIHVRTFQDVEPHLKHAADCRRAERESRGKFGKRGDWHRTMSTPFNIYYAVCQRLGLPLRRIFDSDVAKRIDKELKRDFPLFKTTNDKRI